MHHEKIGLKVGTTTLEVFSGRYLGPNMTNSDRKTIFFHRATENLLTM